MRILFDHNVPAYLAAKLRGHEVTTAYRAGWATLRNGKLLDVAEEARFDLLVTLDKNMEFEQRIIGRALSVAILYPGGQDRADMEAVCAELARRLYEIKPSSILRVRADN